ncbi:hypothetical protein JCM6882_003933 [Rhodosporidiobolus microsporus]
MSRLTATLLLSVLPALVAAQGAPTPQGVGPGRFPCSSVTADGRYNLFQLFCFNNVIVASGDNDPNAINQGDKPTPINSQCVEVVETGAYFCGWQGARCTSDANCDNGVCVGGFCQGGFNQACAGNDDNCLGYLYCTGADGRATASNTCGGIGAFCQDPRAFDPSADAATAAAKFNQYCASGYCNFETGVCDNPPGTTTTPAPTNPAPTSTPFTVSGGVTTTRVIEVPVSVTCGSTSVAANCRAGATRARNCCTADAATCDQIYAANEANCAAVESAYYPCVSTSGADTEECCASVYTAYFGADGGEGEDACAI